MSKSREGLGRARRPRQIYPSQVTDQKESKEGRTRLVWLGSSVQLSKNVFVCFFAYLLVYLLSGSMYQVLWSESKTSKSKWSETISIHQIFTEVGHCPFQEFEIHAGTIQIWSLPLQKLFLSLSLEIFETKHREKHNTYSCILLRFNRC